MLFHKEETSIVSEDATIGRGTRIWDYAKVREGVTIGEECNVGMGVYVDFDVEIGSRVKVQNGAQLFHGTVIEDGVFIGPGVILTNDKHPRAINPNGTLKTNADWTEAGVTIESGASIGAGAVICPGVTIGRWAMIGAGSVVTKDVPPHALVLGNPARIRGWVCPCGKVLKGQLLTDEHVCSRCKGEEQQ